MCGIVGFIGEGNVQEVLIGGLEKLEYRGYDSEGIFVVDKEANGHLFKEQGRIAKLKSEVDFDLQSVVGIGHTRWATHGEPAQHNAHPHVSGKVAVVHNGIVENYGPLKEELIEKGYTFTSETDTEVVAHLVAEAYKETNNLFV